MPIINQKKNVRVLRAMAQASLSAGTKKLVTAMTGTSFTVADVDLNPKKRLPSTNLNRQVRGGPYNSGLPAGSPTPKQRSRWTTTAQLRQLSNSDPVTWSIKRCIKTAITHCDWDIVPDLDAVFKEIDRWMDMCSHSINEWDYVTDFQSAILDPKIIDPLRGEIKAVLKDTELDARIKRFRLATLFDCLKDLFIQQATIHAHVVKQIFNKPNNHREKSLRALLELVTDDLLVFDSGIIIKNRNYYGELAELYTLPGDMFEPLIYEDYTVPQPPMPAYVYGSYGKVLGRYDNSELTQIVENMQIDGFGMGPIEALTYCIIGSLLGDQTYMQNLMEGGIPPLVMNVGDVDDDIRQQFEDRLYETISKHDGNRIVVINSPGTDSGDVQVFPVPKGVDFRSMQISEYRSGLEPAIKCVAFGLTVSDVGLVIGESKTDDPEGLAAALSDRRGVLSRLSLIESYLNSEVVKQEYKFTDVRFKFLNQSLNNNNSLDEARADSVRILNGSMTRNESREKIKLRPLPGGDIATVTVGNQIVQIDTLEPSSEADEFFFDADGNVIDEMGNILVDGGTNPIVTGIPPAQGAGGAIQPLPNQQVKPNRPMPGAPTPAATSGATRGKTAGKARKTDATKRRAENGE